MGDCEGRTTPAGDAAIGQARSGAEGESAGSKGAGCGSSSNASILGLRVAELFQKVLLATRLPVSNLLALL